MTTSGTEAGAPLLAGLRPVRARMLTMILDPDRAAAETLADQLRAHQIDVITNSDPAEALVQAGAVMPDAVLAAAVSTPLFGASIAGALMRRASIPTLIGVAPGEGKHAATALEAGAYACVARPYRIAEILPLLRSISPNHAADILPVLNQGVLRLDPSAHEVYLRGQKVPMPLKEFQLLHLLMMHTGRVLTRQQINHLVWSGDGDASNTLVVHIRRLRAKLGDDHKDPHIIVSVRGMGYRLDPPQQ